MEFKKLKEIVFEYANLISDIGWSNGSHGDDGKGIRDRFYMYNLKLLNMHDFRPSDLEHFDVGEPSEFKQEIEHYKNKQIN